MNVESLRPYALGHPGTELRARLVLDGSTAATADRLREFSNDDPVPLPGERPGPAQ